MRRLGAQKGAWFGDAIDIGVEVFSCWMNPRSKFKTSTLDRKGAHTPSSTTHP